MTKDVYSRPLITLRSQNLHVGDIKKVVGEIISYHEKDYLSPFLVPVGYVSFGLFLAFLFVFHVMVSTINFLLNILSILLCQFGEVAWLGDHL